MKSLKKTGLAFCSLLFLFSCLFLEAQSQVISYFSWDSLAPHLAPLNPHIADTGPNGLTYGLNVRQRTPGHSDYGLAPGFSNSGFPCNNSTFGWNNTPIGADNSLAAGTCRRNIDMVLDNSGGFAGWFDRAELDMSVWYFRKGETDSAMFFSRGNIFKFGMIQNKLAIKYTVNNGGAAQNIPGPACCGISQIFGFFPGDTIPNNIWKLYRFVYSQATGIATIYVDGVVAWSTNPIDQTPGLPMYWTGAPAMMIGSGMDGVGNMRPILDDATVSVPGPLPIKLSYFDAEVLGNYKVNLKWETTHEQNNSSFRVDRSHDGHNWTYLGTIAGSGTTNEKHEYSLLDPSPLKGENFYRLRQTDFNGAEYFLEYVTAKITYSKTGLIALFPNPLNSENELNLLFESIDPGNTIIRIYDTQGKQLAETERIITEGINHLGINVDGFPAGLYFVKVFASGKVFADRFYKGE